MSKFKVGDIVRCVDDSNKPPCTNVSRGWKYEVLAVSGDLIWVESSSAPVSSSRFEKVDKQSKLTFPIIYTNKCFPDVSMALIRGSEGKVSSFHYEVFVADLWTDEEVIENILSGKFLVKSVGNFSYGELKYGV